MKEQKTKAEKIIDAFWLQLTFNVWEIDGESMTYCFVDDRLGSKGEKYNLIMTDKRTNLRYFGIHKLESNGISCFLSFLGKKFKIQKIVNKEHPHIMELEDSEGNVSLWVCTASI